MNKEYLQVVFESGAVSAFDSILHAYHSTEFKLRNDSERLLLLLSLIEQGKQDFLARLNSKEHGKEIFEIMKQRL